MSLRLIYGRSGSGKSRFCLEEINRMLSDNTGETYPLVLIVPEQFSQQAERNLANASERRGTMRAEVLSFRRLAYRVFNETGGRSRKYISSAGKSMILSTIIDELSENLIAFRTASVQKGFIKSVAEIISEFKRYELVPGKLKELAEEYSEEKKDTLLANKLCDLVMLYQAFENSLTENYSDPDDDLSVLCEKIGQSEHFKGAHIWIDEFSGFTPQEYRVIEALLSVGQCVSVALCTDCLQVEKRSEQDFLFEPVRNTAAKLIEIAKSQNIEVELPVNMAEYYPDGNRFSDCPELRHLESNIYAYPYKKYNCDVQNISLSAATNVFSEVEDTARKIKYLCRERNIRYRDIAVVCRDLDSYEKIIGPVFQSYNIPTFIDIKRNILSNNLIIFIMSAIEIVSKNWRYEPVFRYIKTGLTGIDKEELDLLENYVLANGIRGSSWYNNKRWKYKADFRFSGEESEKAEKEHIDKINNLRKLIVEPLLAFQKAVKGNHSAEEFCTALYRLLCSCGIPEQIDKLTDEYMNKGLSDLANEYRQIWNIVMELLDQAVEAGKDEKLTLENFGRMLEAGFEEYDVGLVPASIDQVMVGNVERSRSHEIKALFILGVNDGVFPAAMKEESILSDSDRNKMLESGVELAKDTASRIIDERFLVYTSLTTASNYLCISYPAADFDGKAMRPSRILLDLKKLFPSIKITANLAEKLDEEAEKELIVSPAPTFNELIRAIRRKRDGEKISTIWTGAYKWFQEKEEWGERLTGILEALDRASKTPQLGSDRAVMLYGDPLYSSVSRLETFSSCPFSYFIKYGLKADERKIFKLRPLDVGTFMHNIVEKFSEMLSSEGYDWRELEEDFCRAKVSDIVDSMLEDASVSGSVFNSSKRLNYLAERLKKVVTRTLMLISRHFKQSDFEPMCYEAIFGGKGGFPPITLTLPSGKTMKLTGRIDRIDKLESEEATFIRIVDYKSGSKDLSLSDVYHGLELQLLTYLDAVLGDEEGMEPAGVLYLRLDDPIIRSNGRMSEQEIEKMILKSLKMRGLVLADVNVIRQMDKEISGDSLIIPARINKDNSLGRSSAANRKQFSLLRKYIKKLLAELGGEIMKGNVSVNPYKKRDFTACTYCDYSAICQFDLTLPGNKFRVLRNYDANQVWEQIKGNEKNEER
jgi:ATP-dependent helicase/nuclease subunit B